MNNMDWTLADKSMSKDFEFQNSKSAMKFVNDVTKVSETEKQHPEIHIHSGKIVSVKISILNSGSITEEEICLANLINRIG